MNQSHNFARLLLVVLCLSGCSAMQEQYSEPTSSSKASMRFIASTTLSGNVFASVVPGSGACGSTAKTKGYPNISYVAALHGIAIVHGRRTIGMPIIEQLDGRDFTETYIPATKSFVFDMHSLNTTSATLRSMTIAHCNVTMEFDPEDRHLYEAVYFHEPSMNACTVNVFELVKTENSYERVPVKTVRRRPIQCNWE